MPEPTYARRGQLAAAARIFAAGTYHARELAPFAEDVLRTFDEFARRLDTIEADTGTPCAACRLPAVAHPIDPDNAEGWQPQHRYITPDAAVPASWPVVPLPADYPDAHTLATCGTCGRSWDDDIITAMTPAPGARCPFEMFHEDTDDEHGSTPLLDVAPHSYRAPAPALPAWLATEPPCWRCGEPPEAHHDDDEHQHEPADVAAITVTYYVTAGPAAGPGDARENVRAIFDSVHDNSTALEALREGLAHAGTLAFLAGTSVPELAP